jgi:hypothetical protein
MGKEADAHSFWRFLPSLFLPLQLTLCPATLTRLQTRLPHRHNRPIAGPGRRHTPSFSLSGGHPNLCQQGCDFSCSLGCAIALPYLSSLWRGRSRGKKQLQTDSSVLDIPWSPRLHHADPFPFLPCNSGRINLLNHRASFQKHAGQAQYLSNQMRSSPGTHH